METRLILSLFPSRQQARQAIDILCRFLGSKLDLEENVSQSIDEIVMRDASPHRCQIKLKDVFL